VGEERWVGESDDAFRGIEISIAGGGGEMVRVLSVRLEDLPYIGIFTSLTLVTHHLALYNPPMTHNQS